MLFSLSLEIFNWFFIMTLPLFRNRMYLYKTKGLCNSSNSPVSPRIYSRVNLRRYDPNIARGPEKLEIGKKTLTLCVPMRSEFH